MASVIKLDDILLDVTPPEFESWVIQFEESLSDVTPPEFESWVIQFEESVMLHLLNLKVG